MIKNNISCDNDSENKLKDNLSYALKYKYYDLAFKLIHILFSYYVEENKAENIQLIVSQYYDLFQKNQFHLYRIKRFRRNIPKFKWDRYDLYEVKELFKTDPSLAQQYLFENKD